MVQFEKPEIVSGVDRYHGKVRNESTTIGCEVEADAEPLECELEGLTPSVKHIIVEYACLPDSLGCGVEIEEGFWTPPMGKTILMIKCNFNHAFNLKLLKILQWSTSTPVQFGFLCCRPWTVRG